MPEANPKEVNYYKGKKFETIDILEDIATRDIPEVPKMNIIMAQKYLTRIGKKSDTWKSEAMKSIDFLWRAVFGEWSPINAHSLKVSKEMIEKHKL